MKVSVLAQVPYRDFDDDFEQNYESCVTTPWRLADPGQLHSTFRDALDQMLFAARRGFDGLAFTEHGQSAYDMVPSPTVILSALAYATDLEALDVAIYPVGRSLGKTKEPLRAAEELGMLDCISGGRVMAGLPVGLPYDASSNNGVPPIDVRARFDEGLALMLRAWSEPDPFSFNGRFNQHRNVNLWPRPIKTPPIWLTGIGNPATIAFALENGFGFNTQGWFGIKLTGDRLYSRFWEAAERLGQSRNPHRVAVMQTVCVGDNDADAERTYARHVEYFFNKTLGTLENKRVALPGSIGVPGLKAVMRDPSDFGMFSKMKTATYAELVENGCVIAGGPDTVAEQLIDVCRRFGIGHLLSILQVGSLGKEETERNIALFAEKVLPRLRELWPEDEYPNHWWPERLGGAPSLVSASSTTRLQAV